MTGGVADYLKDVKAWCKNKVLYRIAVLYPASPINATPHDGIYKQIFSHQQVVEALLTGFVHEDWVKLVDLSTLEKPNGQYISEELLQRSEDVIWRVKLNLPEGRQEWLYLYLLIEFQSRSDRWMALRLLTYICLLYQDLIKSGQVKRGKLPPVFPHRYLQRQA